MFFTLINSVEAENTDLLFEIDDPTENENISFLDEDFCKISSYVYTIDISNHISSDYNKVNVKISPDNGFPGFDEYLKYLISLDGEAKVFFGVNSSSENMEVDVNSDISIRVGYMTAGSESEWHGLTAGEFNDTVNITITPVNE